MILLFEIGENQMVSLNKVWISTIPAFRVLLARDKGGPGLGSGKYKKRATQEFTYLYHWLDYHSPLENVPREERKALALEWAGLSDKAKDLEEDEDFQEAVRVYNYLLENSAMSLRTLRSMKNARHSMDDYLNNINFNSKDEGGKLLHDVTKIQNNIIAMPKVQAALDEMEEKVKHEMLDSAEMRGGAEKGFEEDPD